MKKISIWATALTATMVGLGLTYAGEHPRMEKRELQLDKIAQRFPDLAPKTQVIKGKIHDMEGLMDQASRLKEEIMQLSKDLKAEVEKRRREEKRPSR